MTKGFNTGWDGGYGSAYYSSCGGGSGFTSSSIAASSGTAPFATESHVIIDDIDETEEEKNQENGQHMALPQEDELKEEIQEQEALQEKNFYNPYNQPYQDGVAEEGWDQHGEGTVACPGGYCEDGCSQLWSCEQDGSFGQHEEGNSVCEQDWSYEGLEGGSDYDYD